MRTKLQQWSFSGLLLILGPTTALSAPPPWAPAHGYRAQQMIAYSPYLSLDPGQCNRDLLGGALGGAAGAIIGSRVDHQDDRLVAILGGTAIGVLVGGVIGQWMDSIDQNCVAQSLEQAPNNSRITWQGAGPVEYSVTPLETIENGQRYCRRYRTTAVIAGQDREVYGTACRTAKGDWRLAD